jgi:hypothetical protein
MTGSLNLSDFSIPVGQAGGTLTSGSAFVAGNGDGCSATVANIRVASWFGVGFTSTISGQAIPQGENAVYINVRNGDLVARGNISAYSDRRLKSNIQTIDGALDKVMALRGVSFDKHGQQDIGVIAQEVQAVIPEVVHEDTGDEKYLHVAYGNMVGLLIEAIKEQQKQIDELKAKVGV